MLINKLIKIQKPFLRLLSNTILKPLYLKKKVIGGGALKRNKRAVVFSHFALHGHVDKHVFYNLEKIQKELCADIIFVTATKNVKQKYLDRLRKICIKIVLKRNRGRDFSSYYLGLKQFDDLYKYDQVIVTNDSVYGPLYRLDKIFEHMRDFNYQMWSITDSYEREYHLQSYFLVFEKIAFESQFFRKFWKKYFVSNSKSVIINEFEIGFSRLAKEHGIKMGAYCDYYDLRQHFFLDSTNSDMKDNLVLANIKNRTNYRQQDHYNILLSCHCNPSHYFWNYLIKYFNCPYIKVDLIRYNPDKIPNISIFFKTIGNEKICTLIRNHLKSL